MVNLFIVTRNAVVFVEFNGYLMDSPPIDGKFYHLIALHC